MKTKLDLAHDYAMLHMVQNKYKDVDDFEMVKWAVDYADAMFKELEMREKNEQVEKRNKFRELLNSDNTFIEREGQHFEDIQETYSNHEEWQPDWSQAPVWAKWWAMDGFSNKANWYKTEPFLDDDVNEDGDEWNVVLNNSDTYKEAPSFNYQGNWKDSLRERPL